MPDKLADHDLIFMCRAWKGGWVQPIGVFATSAACQATILAEFITKDLIFLHKHGAIVKATVCDGAVTNKSALLLLGVKGSVPRVINHLLKPSTNYNINFNLLSAVQRPREKELAQTGHFHPEACVLTCKTCSMT